MSESDTDPDDNKPDPDENKPDPEPTPDGKPDDTGKEDSLGDAGKRTIATLRKASKAAEKERDALAAKLKEYTDKDKSESERLSEAKTAAESRASKAESSLTKFQIAMDKAPEGATLAQVRAVAKRLHGDTEDELEADAEELFELVGTKATEPAKKSPPGTKPRPNLKGGGDPEEEPEEMDPRKLAEIIGRRF